MAPIDLPSIPPTSPPPPDDSERRREEREAKSSNQRFLRRLAENRTEPRHDAQSVPTEGEHPESATPSESRRPARSAQDERSKSGQRTTTANADTVAPSANRSSDPAPESLDSGLDPALHEESQAHGHDAAIDPRGESAVKDDAGKSALGREQAEARPRKGAPSAGEKRAESSRSAERANAHRAGREDVESAVERIGPPDELRIDPTADASGSLGNSGLGIGARDLPPTTTDAPISQYVVRQAVEFAAFSERGGVMEFSLGLTANVLGGAVMTLRALGDRKIAIKVANGKSGKAIEAGDLEDLIARLKARDIEVVEVVVS